MRCPKCGCSETNVKDTRIAEEGKSVKRRRECSNCNARFTTFERIVYNTIFVIKKNGKKEIFEIEKLRQGIQRACGKRLEILEKMDDLISELEHDISTKYSKEIPSVQIGEEVLSKLKDIDEVSYVRFASVYRHFDNIQAFIDELEQLSREKRGK